MKVTVDFDVCHVEIFYSLLPLKYKLITNEKVLTDEIII